MRRGLISSWLAVLASAGMAVCQTVQPPGAPAAQDGPPAVQTTPKPVTPVIPMRSDAGIPFEVQATPGASPCDRELAPEEPYVPRVWISGEYLMRWMKDAPLAQPLVTSTSADPFVNPGVIGQDGTVILFGGDRAADYGMINGFRASAGVALDRNGACMVEASFVWLQQSDRSTTFQSDMNGAPVISRPLFNRATNEEGVFLVAFPENFAGRIAINSSSQYWAADTNVVRNLVSAHWGGIDFISGVRYADLEEDLVINDQSIVLPLSGQGGRFLGAIVPPGNTLSKTDSFETRNQFIGAQLGLKAELRRGNWFVFGRGQLALGNTHQVVTIGGSSTLTPDGGTPTTVPGGLLALPTNIGRFAHDNFALLPELNVNLGYQVTDGIRVFVGYDLTYWSNVVRPGDQIDRNVNRSYVPTSEFFGGSPFPTDPVILFQRTDWWMQGINLGIAVRF